MNLPAATLSRLAYRRPTQQLWQLGEVHRNAPRLVARQPNWSLSGATQRYVRNRGRSGSDAIMDQEAITTNNRCTAATAANNGSAVVCAAMRILRPKTGRRSVDD